MTLMIARRLTPLFLTQLLGAVNDNLFKNALVVLILFRAAESSGPALVALAGGMFILPYALLSATAGQLADRYDKRSLILVVKCAEVLLMALAAAGFLLGSVPWLLCVLFGLGIQATFFGPLKYAILPQILNEGELIAGNGLIEAGTFMGILAGTIAGPLLFGLVHGAAIVSAAGLTIAAAGVATALFLSPAAPSRQDIRVRWNLAGETVRLVALARDNRPVWLCILGVSWFWVMGATLLAELPTLVRETLASNGQVFTVLLAAFSVGVGIGSMACSRLLRGEVSARLVPFAAIGLSVFLWDFGRTASHAGVMSDVAGLLHQIAGWRMTLDLVLLAACGGIYSVPLYAIIQAQSEPGHLARMIGANNVVNAAAMVASALATAALAMAGVISSRHTEGRRDRERGRCILDRPPSATACRAWRLPCLLPRPPWCHAFGHGESPGCRHACSDRGEPPELCRWRFRCRIPARRADFRRQHPNSKALVGAAVPGRGARVHHRSRQSVQHQDDGESGA